MVLEQIKLSSSKAEITTAYLVSDSAVMVSDSFFHYICEFLDSLKESMAEFFQGKNVKKLDQDPLRVKVAKEEKQAEKKEEAISQIRQLLKEPISAFEKLKNWLSLPPSLSPLLEMVMKKGTQLDVQASIENQFLGFITNVTIPSGSLKGKAMLQVPLVPPAAKDAAVEVDPAMEKLMKTLLAKLLSVDPKTAEKLQLTDDQKAKDLQFQEDIFKILLTLPSQLIHLTWVKGSADISVTLPGGAVLKLTFEIPLQPNEKNDFHAFLQTLLKENYKGIASLLSKDMVFTWAGSHSQFKIQFPQQIALRLHKLEIENEGLASLLGSHTTVVLPQSLTGTVNFKENSIEFGPGTTFQIKKKFPLPDKDITMKKIAYDPIKNTIKLNLSTSLIVDVDLPEITIDLNESKKPAPQKPAGKSLIDFEFIPFDSPVPLSAAAAKKQTAVKRAPEKPTVPVFETIKNLIQIPVSFLPMVKKLFAGSTALDLKVGLSENVTLSSEIKLPDLGLLGHAQLIVPTKTPASPDTLPADLHPGIEKLLSQKLSSKIKDAHQLREIMDLLLTLPTQDIHIDWRGAENPATVILTLPKGMILKLDLKIPDSDKKDQPDIVRELLKTVLKEKFAAIEPLLSQSFVFKWSGSASKFRIEFVEQQVFHLKSLQLKKEGLLKTMVANLVGWIVRGTSVALPRKIEGTASLKDASVKFNNVKFTVKTGLFSKEIGLESVSFNPDKNEVNLGIECFGSHALSIDLNESNVEDFNFAILSRLSRRPDLAMIP
ncbi:MAG: hypothetical protein JSS10_00275 [Verrucomicrobia bacterium]|nr:hypothetical protein [Verrucomicrobiota bacterium]